MKINFYYELITSNDDATRNNDFGLWGEGGWNLIYIGAPNWVSGVFLFSFFLSLFIAKQ